MYPKLFEIPFLHLTIWTYGPMMVIGFLSAVFVIRRLSRDITPDPQLITNAALYSLIAGVVGARTFYVVHHFDKFRYDLLSVFSVWQGGLELLGGVVAAITVIALYLRYHKLPIRKYLDILAIGLLLALSFGRIGCFLRGCCFGKPTDLPWAVRFPYASHPYNGQINPNSARNRNEPQLKISSDFLEYTEKDGLWYSSLKPYEKLTEQQKYMVDKGPYRCLPVHPTQLYSSANALLCCLILYLFWRRSQNTEKSGNQKPLAKPGGTFALMFILYGLTRFLIEFLRDDNPFEFDSLTISQIIGLVIVPFGVVLMAVFQTIKTDVSAPGS